MFISIVDFVVVVAVADLVANNECADAVVFAAVFDVIVIYADAYSDPVKQPRWRFLLKQLMAFSNELFSQKAPS